jgi:hypothetical protein
VVFTAAVFLFELSLGRSSCGTCSTPAASCRRAGSIPVGREPRALAARDPWPLLTSIFLHGGVLHLVSNLWALWIFGDNIEDRLGAFRFLVFFVTCGLARERSTRCPFPLDAAHHRRLGRDRGSDGRVLRVCSRARVVLTIFPLFCVPLFLELPAVRVLDCGSSCR